MPSSSITLEQCQRLFHHPVEYACRELGVSRPTIARVMRQAGYKRWPFRKIRASTKRNHTDPGPSRSRKSLSPRPASAPTSGDHRIPYVRRSERNLALISNDIPVYKEDDIDIDDDDIAMPEELHQVRNRKRARKISVAVIPLKKKITTVDESKKVASLVKNKESSETNKESSEKKRRASTDAQVTGLPNDDIIKDTPTLLPTETAALAARNVAINGDVLPIPIAIPSTSSLTIDGEVELDGEGDIPISVSISKKERKKKRISRLKKKKKKNKEDKKGEKISKRRSDVAHVSGSSSLRPPIRVRVRLPRPPRLPLPPCPPRLPLPPPPLPYVPEQSRIPTDMEDETVMVPGGAVPWMSISRDEQNVLGIPTFSDSEELRGIQANDELEFGDQGWPLL